MFILFLKIAYFVFLLPFIFDGCANCFDQELRSRQEVPLSKTQVKASDSFISKSLGDDHREQSDDATGKQNVDTNDNGNLIGDDYYNRDYTDPEDDQSYKEYKDMREKRARVSQADKFRKYKHRERTKNRFGPKTESVGWRIEVTEGPQDKLDQITSQIWRRPAAMEIEQSWVHPFCLRFSTLEDEVAKTLDSCQFLGVAWDCVYAKLADEGGSFSMRTLAEKFDRVPDEKLRSRLLDGIAKCNNYWDKYRYEEARMLLAHEIRAEVEHRTFDGEKGFAVNQRPSREVDIEGIRELRRKKMKETQNRKKMDQERNKEINKRLRELNSIKNKSDEEKAELAELLMQKSATTVIPSLIGMDLAREERIQFAYKAQLSQCITQEVVTACEPKVMHEINKLV